MPIGNNLSSTDKLIKKTTGKTNIANKTSKVNSKSRVKHPAKNIATENTEKMTFYVKKDLLKKLYNFAYWDRYNVTEAFNKALSDGLKNKNTKPKE